MVVGPLSANALTHTETVGDVSMTVYAPDWIWQKSAVNILVTFENSGDDDAAVSLKLTPPAGKADHFEIDPGISEGESIIVPAGESARHALTNIIALDGVHLQTYAFAIIVNVDGESVNVSYPLTTIRGPVVNTAAWATLLPAVLCVLWCIVFVAALRRFATPGAWKEPSHLDLDLDDPS